MRSLRPSTAALGVLTISLFALQTGLLAAQVPASPEATPAAQVPAAPGTPASPDAPGITAAPATDAAPPAPSAARPAFSKVETDTFFGKHTKEVYTGPTEIVQLAPTPMLDEEGIQRLDPDGKPMFNPPVKQQRDKKGHPLFDEKGKPVFQTATELGYDEKGKKIHLAKEKPPKMTPVSVVGGTYTVDGVIGKAALNYEIADLKYIYLYAPGIGIAVVSNEPFAGGTEQKNAFSGTTLTVNVGEHVLQLASDKELLGKKQKPESAYVLLDRQFTLPSRYPVVGYGTVTKAPYVWPGSKANPVMASAVMKAPPPPSNLMPVLLLKPCPAGMMRMAGPKVLPGQVAKEQPCVPIVKGTATVVKTPTTKTPASTPAPAASPVPTASAKPASNPDAPGGASE